jgi:hypothetical protein
VGVVGRYSISHSIWRGSLVGDIGLLRRFRCVDVGIRGLLSEVGRVALNSKQIARRFGLCLKLDLNPHP